jgi:hypothetical protein
MASLKNPAALLGTVGLDVVLGLVLCLSWILRVRTIYMYFNSEELHFTLFRDRKD